jgi:hypothetical protein
MGNTQPPLSLLRFGHPSACQIERKPNLEKALIHKLIWRYDPLKSPSRLPEDPILLVDGIGAGVVKKGNWRRNAATCRIPRPRNAIVHPERHSTNHNIRARFKSYVFLFY